MTQVLLPTVVLLVHPCVQSIREGEGLARDHKFAVLLYKC